MKTMTVSGQTIGKAKFDSLIKGVSSVSENITMLATYCAGLAIVHNDLDALNQRLLKIQAFRNSSGDLNALGKRVVQYVAAHTAGFMSYDAKAGAFKFKKFGGKDGSEKKAAARGFYHPETGEITQRFVALETPQSMEFSFTFQAFWSFKKAANKPVTPSVKVATVAKSLAKAVESADAGNTAGTVEEYVSAIDAALKLVAAFARAGGDELLTAWSRQSGIDIEAMMTSATVKPSSKAKAAPKMKPFTDPSPVEPGSMVGDAVVEAIERLHSMASAKMDVELAESRENAKKRAAV